MKINVLRSAFTVLFTVLICLGVFTGTSAGEFILTSQNMLIIFASLIMGGVQGTGATGLFILLGITGLPVFGGFTGGLKYLNGPGGGFLIGYFIASFVTGLIAGTPHIYEKKASWKYIARIFTAALLGFIIIYIPAIPWFINVMSKAGKTCTFIQAVDICFFPYILSDIIKLCICLPLTLLLRPLMAKILYPDDEKESEEMLRKIKSKKK